MRACSGLTLGNDPETMPPMRKFLSCFRLVLWCGVGVSVGHAGEKGEVTLREVHKGTLEVDTRLLDSGGGLSAERRAFYLSARELLTGSAAARTDDAGVVDAAVRAGVSLMAGPMLGEVSESGISVWFRPVRAEDLTLRVTAVEGPWKKEIAVRAERAGAVVRTRVSGLQPDSGYEYQLVDGAGGVLGDGSFRTVPAAGSGETYRIAFGSCFHKIGVHNPDLMGRIAERGARAMLLLGDLAVDDREAEINLHSADYLLRDVSGPWRKFAAQVPVYASWDDHDYLNNDKSGLQSGQITEPERAAMRDMWREHWINPERAGDAGGIYFNTVIGDVEVIMLDTRSCRDWGKQGSRGSYLGEEQMDWLLRTLRASTAKFIILTSGTMWSDAMSGAKDSWGTWDIPAREEIYDLIEANRIGGVLLLSGDRHGARGFRIERPSGFKLVEFEAASLGGVPGPKAYAPDRTNQLFGYAGGLKAFGEFTFDMGKADPEVTFRLIDGEGKVLQEHRYRRSELTPGDGKNG